MSKAQAMRYLMSAQRSLMQITEGLAIDRREWIVKAAISDMKLWTAFPRQRKAMRETALIEAGWNFSWGDTGECGAFAARWMRAGLVYLGDCGFGEHCEVEKRTATPRTMITAFQKWGRFLEPASPSIEHVGPGDLIVTTDVSTGHAGIVEHVAGSTIHTIEANYSGGINRVARDDLSVIIGFGSVR